MDEPAQSDAYERSTYAQVARTSRVAAVFFVLADFGWLCGLIGVIVCPLVMLLQWPLDYLHSGEGHEQLRHWTFYVLGAIVTFCVFATMFVVSAFVRGRIYFRFVRETHSRG